jgi:hypothetical protein
MAHRRPRITLSRHIIDNSFKKAVGISEDLGTRIGGIVPTGKVVDIRMKKSI